ncbi:hypothetical protein GCM10010472_02210 [Pseudonocardia halophobica]|uniref:Uncharacterized protein n=1 Tax=Pseudonocardia halophobica TaxID=29401 RepID=A0A9W6KYX1_9PSEU|nr:hypothetical protein [Pseudonocardia halophobica]GLL10561.1 hypothetical protein GCM10017577_17010 [Pseudonocardia halophobica]
MGSGQALKAHATGPALAELTAAVEGRLAKPLEVVRLAPIPAGDEALGAV